jgi:8-oxo-dGTP diphosphatase
MFLAKRSKNARDEHGRWDVGGGGLKHGQTLEQNVRRELLEEYGVEPLKVDFIGYREVFRQLPDGTPTHWIAMDFAVRVDPGQVKISEPDMFDDSGWFHVDKFPSPLHSQLSPAMEKYSARLRELAAA